MVNKARNGDFTVDSVHIKEYNKITEGMLDKLKIKSWLVKSSNMPSHLTISLRDLLQ